MLMVRDETVTLAHNGRYLLQSHPSSHTTPSIDPAPHHHPQAYGLAPSASASVISGLGGSHAPSTSDWWPAAASGMTSRASQQHQPHPLILHQQQQPLPPLQVNPYSAYSSGGNRMAALPPQAGDPRAWLQQQQPLQMPVRVI